MNNIRTTPWLVQGAIDFLTEYFKTHRNSDILEFGMGGSTIWFAKRTTKLVSVEHNEKWLNEIYDYIENQKQTGNIKYYFLQRPYNTFCNMFSKDIFDIVLINGRDRVKCIESSIRILKPGGILMLNNSERIRYQPGKDLMKTWKMEEAIDENSFDPDENGIKKPWTTTWWTKPI